MNTDTEQNNKISELERRLDVATTGFVKDIESIKDIMKMGFDHVTEAIKDFEKKTENNQKELLKLNDKYQAECEEKCKTMDRRIRTVEKQIWKWAGAIGIITLIVNYVLQKI